MMDSNLHMALLDIRNGKDVPEVKSIIEDAKHELSIFSEQMMSHSADD